LTAFVNATESVSGAQGRPELTAKGSILNSLPHRAASGLAAKSVSMLALAAASVRTG
jgi:hypothetical protein